jgi:cytochrome c peroxidase
MPSLRGIKNQPPYLHDGRLPTLDDAVEFFNLVLGTKLAPQEKQDLVAFLRTLESMSRSGGIGTALN